MTNIFLKITLWDNFQIRWHTGKIIFCMCATEFFFHLQATSLSPKCKQTKYPDLISKWLQSVRRGLNLDRIWFKLYLKFLIFIAQWQWDAEGNENLFIHILNKVLKCTSIILPIPLVKRNIIIYSRFLSTCDDPPRTVCPLYRCWQPMFLSDLVTAEKYTKKNLQKYNKILIW